MATPNTLIYKMTHLGDPSPDGIWGHSGKKGCMGQVRSWSYDAVIGVGGKTAKDKDDNSHVISFKIIWIGINPEKNIGSQPPRILVTFKHWRYFKGQHPDIKKECPKLYKYMFEGKIRSQLSRNLKGKINIINKINNEITKIIKLAKKYRKSKKLNSLNRSNKKRKNKKLTNGC